jgi:hypothetical protein
MISRAPEGFMPQQKAQHMQPDWQHIIMMFLYTPESYHRSM